MDKDKEEYVAGLKQCLINLGVSENEIEAMSQRGWKKHICKQITKNRFDCMAWNIIFKQYYIVPNEDSSKIIWRPIDQIIGQINEKLKTTPDTNLSELGLHTTKDLYELIQIGMEHGVIPSPPEGVIDKPTIELSSG